MSHTRGAILASAALLLIALGPVTASADTISFSGGFEGTGFVSPGTGTRCPDLIVNISASGTLNPLGPFTTNQSHCISPPSPDITQGQFTQIFANGTLDGTYTAVITGPPVNDVVPILGSLVFSGGTGAFAGATGGGVANVTQNLVTGFSIVELRGTVTAPGLTAVPEPTTMLLLGTGLAGIGMKLRKRCQAKAE